MAPKRCVKANESEAISFIPFSLLEKEKRTVADLFFFIYCYCKAADVNGQDIAINLKRRKLFEMFPGVDRTALEEVFQANQ